MLSSASLEGCVTSAGFRTIYEMLGCTLINEGMIEAFTWMLKVRTDAMAMQTKAVAVHNLPSQACFTGEGDDDADDGIDRWLKTVFVRGLN